MDERLSLIFNDLVVREDTCNFRCTYCLLHENNLKVKTISDSEADVERKTLFEPLHYLDGSELKKRLDGVMERFEKVADAAILRVSGGEILQIKGIFEFFKSKSTNYESIQVLTNGYRLDQDMLNNLKSLGNAQVHMSIDGHNLDLNGYRVANQRVQDTLMRNLDATIRSGIPTEVGSVLTKRNMRTYSTFLDYMLAYEDRVTIYPFPVRGNVKGDMWPEMDDIESFVESVVGKYEKYAGILPPKPFLDELCFLLLNGYRRLRCHVPAVMVQSFDDGVITPCPNCWATQLGDIRQEDPEEVMERFGKDKIYNVFLWPVPRLPFCKQCYTSFDIVNLYINGYLSDEDVLKNPLLGKPLAFERLSHTKSLRTQELSMQDSIPTEPK